MPLPAASRSRRGSSLRPPPSSRTAASNRSKGTPSAARSVAALQAAGLSPQDVGHVNAHGASTPNDDRIEAQAIRATLGDVPVTAPKSCFGNLGAGSGAVELVASVLALQNGLVPPTLKLPISRPRLPGQRRPRSAPGGETAHRRGAQSLALRSGHGGGAAGLEDREGWADGRKGRKKCASLEARYRDSPSLNPPISSLPLFPCALPRAAGQGILAVRQVERIPPVVEEQRMPNRTKGAVLAVAAVVMVLAAARWAEPAPPPAPPAADNSPQRIRRLVQELGDKDYFVRQRAQTELAALGFEAFDVLSEATASEDPEVAARARYLLRLMRVEWADRDDPPEVKQLLQDYESQDSAQRQATHAPAGGPARLERHPRPLPPGAVREIGGCCRSRRPSRCSAWPSRGRTRRRRSWRRCGRSWARAIVRPPSGCWPMPASAKTPPWRPAPWSKLVDAEESLLQASSEATTREIVVALVHFQVARLKKLGRNDEALAAMRRLIRLENGDTETLVELLQWLIEQKAWKVVDEAADRFAPVIAGNAVALLCRGRGPTGPRQEKPRRATRRPGAEAQPGQGDHAVYGHYRRGAAACKSGGCSPGRRGNTATSWPPARRRAVTLWPPTAWPRWITIRATTWPPPKCCKPP